MFHLKRWSDKQHKRNIMARKRAEVADDERARKEQGFKRKSYSATHKPYERTAYGSLIRSEGEKYERTNESGCAADVPEL